MIQALYDSMDIPSSCYLNKRVFKKLFHENAQLGVTDKKAFREDIDIITWLYTLKPSTIPVRAYVDNQREYQEIAVLQVDLKTLKRTGRISEVIHRAIPYPLIVVFAYGTKCALSLAHKRFSQAEKGAIVVEEFHTTEWIDLTGPIPIQLTFLDSIALSGLPQTHFYALYSALVERAIALDCARLSGVYRIVSTHKRREVRRKRLAQCHELEVQIGEQKAAIKAESAFNRQVELNTKIKSLEKRLKVESSRL